MTLHLPTRSRAVLALSFDGAVTFPARVLLSVFLGGHVTQARNCFYTNGSLLVFDRTGPNPVKFADAVTQRIRRTSGLDIKASARTAEGRAENSFIEA